MIDFHHRALPWNVRFASGATQQLPAELDALGLGQALVLSTPGHRAKA